MPSEKRFYIVNNGNNLYSGLDTNGKAIFTGVNLNMVAFNNDTQAWNLLDDLFDNGALNLKEIFTVQEWFIQI